MWERSLVWLATWRRAPAWLPDGSSWEVCSQSKWLSLNPSFISPLISRGMRGGCGHWLQRHLGFWEGECVRMGAYRPSTHSPMRWVWPATVEPPGPEQSVSPWGCADTMKKNKDFWVLAVCKHCLKSLTRRTSPTLSQHFQPAARYRSYPPFELKRKWGRERGYRSLRWQAESWACPRGVQDGADRCARTAGSLDLSHA